MVSRLHRRQDPVDAPSSDGLVSNTAKVVATGATGTALVFDTSASPAPTNQAPPPPPVLTSTFVDPDAPLATSPAAPPQATQSVAPAAASSNTLALSTVIGACVGAFIGAAAFIALALFFYRRYSANLKRRNFRSPHSRNAKGDHERRRSHMEAWNKLDDMDDAWDDRRQTKEVDHVAPMEKLTMFKKSTPSVRTAYTTAPDDTPLEYPPSFAPFDPKLAQTLGSTPPPMPEARPYLGRIDANPIISWDNDSLANISSRSNLTSHGPVGGAVSPSLTKAIPTPAATHFSHKWESAEVLGYSTEAQTAPVEGLITAQPAGDDDDRKSIHNPFFGSQDYTTATRSRSSSVRSRSNSVKTRVESVCPHPLTGPLVKSDKAKGKERMRYSQAQSVISNGGDSAPAPMPLPQPPTPTIRHTQTPSVASVESKEHALKSLMAALEISEDEVKDRLRVASMQPSIISQTSQYTVDGDDMTKEFPLPPHLHLALQHQQQQPRP